MYYRILINLGAFSDTGTDYATHFTDTWLDSDTR